MDMFQVGYGRSVTQHHVILQQEPLQNIANRSLKDTFTSKVIKYLSKFDHK